MAAKHYLINSTKQINPKVIKVLKGKSGPQGLQGKEGPVGKEGKEGPIGKEGPVGKEGKQGEPGSALGYAAVTEGGELIAGRSKGVVSVTHPVTGLYCFQLSFTPQVGSASPAHITGNFKTFAEVEASKADVEKFTGTCTAPNNDASVVIADGELVDDQFYVMFD